MNVYVIKILRLLELEYPLENYEPHVSDLKKLGFVNKGYQALLEEILERKKITSIEYLQLQEQRLREIDSEIKKRNKIVPKID